MSATTEFVISACESDEEMRIVYRGLIAYNKAASHGGIDLPCDEDIRLVLKNPDGKVLGGVGGHIALYCFFVEDLWVDENAPLGSGMRLMVEAERMAKAKGCVFAQTSTFSFQSPKFYLRCGYEAAAVVDDFPNRVKQYYFRKRL